MDADRELFAIFRAEVEEQIEDLCGLLEREPGRWRVARLFQISHNVKGAARLVGVAPVRDAAHALEDLFAAVRDGAELAAPVVEAARAGADVLSACFESIDGGETPDIGAFRRQVDDVVASGSPAKEGGRGRTGRRKTRSRTKDAPPSATLDEGSSSPAAVETAAEADGHDAAEEGRVASSDTLRVALDKIDALMDTSSEFVSLVFRLEAHLSGARSVAALLAGAARRDRHIAADPGVREALGAARELHRQIRDHAGDSLRISDELQTSVRALRMVRIDGLKTLAGQTVRATCRDLGRTARLVLSGASTEVDRMVLDQLRDPLVHLLRNAVAHGIEPEAERVAAGKPATGTVELTASSAGEWVEVAVRDDGRGVAADSVREHALAKHVVAEAELAELDDDAVLDLLFRTGMSTSGTVTEVSGRGVGLDVVRSRLRALGGSATLRSSRGHGSEILLRMPLTRLTTSGVLVRAGRQVVAIPVAWVERTVQVARTHLTTVDGADAITLDGGLVPLTSLGTILGAELEETDHKPAVLVSDGRVRRAILVDAVIGQREYIVQPLPWNLRRAPAVAGCTVLDGSTVVLVMDPAALVGRGGAVDAWGRDEDTGRSVILVVDDSATSRTLERTILRTAGYEVITAVSGEQALEVLGGQPVDLVVSDVEMPGLNGFDLTRTIRSDARTRRIPVILVTSLGSEEHRREGAEAGADAYIVKGAFDQDELLASVARLL